VAGLVQTYVAAMATPWVDVQRVTICAILQLRSAPCTPGTRLHAGACLGTKGGWRLTWRRSGGAGPAHVCHVDDDDTKGS
jgi:hypothetical protein